jgi:hypothetical protein
MAVFIAASDETSGGDTSSPFHYAGWIAPEPDWTLYFTPAWQERVLVGPPEIPYLHMTDMRSKAWREKYGISESDAEDRLDAAAILISQLGSLFALMFTVNRAEFNPLYKEHKVIVASGATTDFQPDFLAFVCYAYGVLKYVHDKHPDAEKVDFLVENNRDITKHINEFYKVMPNALNYIGAPELIPLLGEFLPGGKDRAPLQAADYLAWHSRRADSDTLDERSSRRFNTIGTRKGYHLTIPTDVLTGLSDSYKKHGLTNEQLKGIRELRPQNARTNEPSARRDQKSNRRRKGGKTE